MYLFIGISVIFVLIYFYFKRSYSFWKDRGFIHMEPSIPLGNFGSVGFKEHLSEYMRREYNNYKDKGPAYGMYMLTNPGLVITDPELIKEVCSTSFEHFHERGLYVNEKADPLWKNVFTAGGQEWKELRAKLTPTFTSGRIKMMFPILSEVADRMIEHLKKLNLSEDGLEMKEIYAEFTTEVIANVAFGLDIKCIGQPDNEFRKIAKSVFDPPKWQHFKNFMIFALPDVAKFFNMALTPRFVTDFFLKTVRENMEYREKNNIRRNDFFQLLLDIKNSYVGMTLNEIAANSFAFFTAGFETSSSAMTFCTYELALNQTIQDRLRDEIEEVLRRYNGELTYDAISEMKYLDMVFKETLRRYPILDSHMRKCVKDYKIPNTNLVIPSGVTILVPVYAIQNDEEYFTNPEKFDPERFTEENVKKQIPFTYMPFSEGPRTCIGLRFGTMQTKIGLIKILRNFRILPSKKTLIPMKFAPNAGFQLPFGGMWIKLENIK
uniref:Cytochrome P450 6EV10 n=1 Tax=Chironomus kiiensis TaxID=84408 RepID=W6E8Q3_CHIKI|nr:cytochrome P450 6EV10 [Chironomus kiiensis]